MSKATLAKIFGAVAAGALLLQGFINAQGSLTIPHDLHGWLDLVSAFAVYAIAHHASGTDGTK